MKKRIEMKNVNSVDSLENEELKQMEENVGSMQEEGNEVKEEGQVGTGVQVDAELERLTQELEKAKAEVERYKDLYLRSVADSENFKRQKEKQMMELLKYAEEPVIKLMIQILDDFSRALKSVKDESVLDAKKVLDGLQLIEHKFIKVLEERGVKKIESRGKKLDVRYHEALAQIEKEGVESETIVEVFEEGYELHERVIRYAKVVVAK